jgi:hypothetical protein
MTAFPPKAQISLAAPIPEAPAPATMIFLPFISLKLKAWILFCRPLRPCGLCGFCGRGPKDGGESLRGFSTRKDATTKTKGEKPGKQKKRKRIKDKTKKERQNLKRKTKPKKKDKT